ncbi:glutaredoxin family protein [Patescibacteria group bacterium]
MADKTITIYTSPTCAYCQQAKAYFDEKGISYEDKDVTEDTKFADESVEKSGQFGVPVIEINDEIIVGFDKEALEKKLAE